MGALRSLLGSRSEAEELKALLGTWNGTYDVERGRTGWRAYCLREDRAPVTGRTLRKLNAAIVADWTTVTPPAPEVAA